MKKTFAIAGGIALAAALAAPVFAKGSSSGRTSYSGSSHTSSHGGSYSSGSGSSHRGGTYTSPQGGGTYGKHKK